LKTVAEIQKAKAEMLKEHIEKRARMSKKEIEDFHKTVCGRCEYAVLEPATRTFRSCDYILVEKEIRPCATGDCIKAGVFKERSRSTGRREIYDNRTWNKKGVGGLAY